MQRCERPSRKAADSPDSPTAAPGGLSKSHCAGLWTGSLPGSMGQPCLVVRCVKCPDDKCKNRLDNFDQSMPTQLSQVESLASHAAQKPLTKRIVLLAWQPHAQVTHLASRNRSI